MESLYCTVNQKCKWNVENYGACSQQYGSLAALSAVVQPCRLITLMYSYMNGAIFYTSASLNKATQWSSQGVCGSNTVFSKTEEEKQVGLCEGTFDLKSERGQWDFVLRG